MLIKIGGIILKSKREFTQIAKEERYLFICKRYLEEKSTLRAIGEKYCVSKSNLHKFIRNELRDLDCSLYKELIELIELNKKERALRGGLALKNKILKNK